MGNISAFQCNDEIITLVIVDGSTCNMFSYCASSTKFIIKRNKIILEVLNSEIHVYPSNTMEFRFNEKVYCVSDLLSLYPILR